VSSRRKQNNLTATFNLTQYFLHVCQPTVATTHRFNTLISGSDVLKSPLAPEILTSIVHYDPLLPCCLYRAW